MYKSFSWTFFFLNFSQKVEFLFIWQKNESLLYLSSHKMRHWKNNDSCFVIMELKKIIKKLHSYSTKIKIRKKLEDFTIFYCRVKKWKRKVLLLYFLTYAAKKLTLKAFIVFSLYFRFNFLLIQQWDHISAQVTIWTL